MTKGIEQGVAKLIRHWSELARLAKVSGSHLPHEQNSDQALPPGISNRHDYYQGVADAFKQASVQVEALLNNRDDVPSASETD